MAWRANSESRVTSNTRWAAIVVALLLGCMPVRAATATEAWADPDLPLSEGLELWLDAGRPTGDKPLPIDGKLVEWRDASGKQRDLKQTESPAQPVALKFDSGAVVRFDGIDDCLRATNTGGTLESFTIAVVAAPRRNLGGFRGFLALNAPNARDYESGLTIDQGPSSAAKFS